MLPGLDEESTSLVNWKMKNVGIVFSIMLGRPTEDSRGFKPDLICGPQKYVAASG